MQEIEISDILLALDNPRLDEAQTEEQAISFMIENQKDKLLILAEDIIENGLSPLDIIAVYPSETRTGKFIVAEGNRRITVLKILNDPSILLNVNLSYYKKFLKISDEYNPISQISAHIFKRADDPILMHWLEIRHAGEQGGRGIAKWDSVQKQRFLKKIKGEDLLIDFWILLENNKILSYEEILSITKTNWERILRNVGLDFLKLGKTNNTLNLPKNISLFKLKMKQIHKKLAYQTVKMVYDQKAIEDFFNDISLELFGEEYPPKQQTLDDVKNNDNKLNPISETVTCLINNECNNFEESNDNIIITHEKEIKHIDNIPLSSSTDIFRNCSSIIPKKMKLSCKNVRINKIINELKELNVDQYPNSCGALLRLLFELSSKYYMEKLTGEVRTDTNFKANITAAANDMRIRKILHDQEHSSLLKETETMRLIFNGYMHNTDSYPSSESIKSIFKAHKKFIENCLK